MRWSNTIKYVQVKQDHACRVLAFLPSWPGADLKGHLGYVQGSNSRPVPVCRAPPSVALMDLSRFFSLGLSHSSPSASRPQRSPAHIHLPAAFYIQSVSRRAWSPARLAMSLDASATLVNYGQELSSTRRSAKLSATSPWNRITNSSLRKSSMSLSRGSLPFCSFNALMNIHLSASLGFFKTQSVDALYLYVYVEGLPLVLDFPEYIYHMYLSY